MEQNETGCEAPQAPLLCVNKCGFFGTAATMNMCSKCYKDLALNQEQANLAASSIQSIIVNGSSSSNVVENEKVDDPDASRSQAATSDPTLGLQQTPSVLPDGGQKNEEQGPKRCGACRKRVGLTGFTCRCGTTFCAIHRYTDKHDCQFDYRSAAQEAIAKANPVVKADKIDKI